MAAKTNNVTSFELARHAKEIREAMLEQGYTKIANALLEAIAQLELSGRQHRVMSAILRKTIGFQKDFDWLVAEQVAEVMNYTGDLANIRSDIRKLKERRIVIQNGKRIGINMVVSEWIEAKPKKTKSKQVKNNPLTGRNQPANRSKSTHKRVDSDPTKEKETHIKKSIKNICPASVTDVDSNTVPHEPKSEPKSEPKQNQASSDLTEIFDHWKNTMNHPRSRLDNNRKKLISNALKTGYSAEDLKTAIDGCARTAFNMGQNPQGRVYDSLELILRNADKIDGYMRNASLVMNNQGQQPQHSSHDDLDDISWMTGIDGYQPDNGDLI